MHLLELNQFSVSFPAPGRRRGAAARVTAIDQVSFRVEQNEILGIVGESGCGKTTLSRGILALLKDTGGEVLLDGRDVRTIGRREISRRIQMIFQNPLASFNPHYKISDALREAARVHRIPQAEYRQTVRELLEYTGLSPEMAEQYPAQLSGGQLQRFAICRALLTRPEILIADEAVSALDVSIQTDILNLLLHLREKLGITIIFISHDLHVVENICDRVLVMYLGSIVEIGRTETIFGNPGHPYTRLLLASETSRDPDAQRERSVQFEDIPSILDVPSGCRFRTRCPHCLAGICDAGTPAGHWVDADHRVYCNFQSDHYAGLI